MAKRLSKRLQAVADLIDTGSYLADVGSDHALLPIELVKQGKLEWAMAIENKVGPYLHMCNAISDAGLNAHIFCSKSDGISVLNDGVNEIAICGMGGLLSCDILEAHPENLRGVKAIILDPHRDLSAVRKRVSALGFHIEEETMVYEDKIYYTIIKFVAGAPKTPYSALDLAFGPVLRKRRDPIFLEWLNVQKKTLNGLLNKNLSPSAREHYLRLYRAVRDEIGSEESESR